MTSRELVPANNQSSHSSAAIEMSEDGRVQAAFESLVESFRTPDPSSHSSAVAVSTSSAIPTLMEAKWNYKELFPSFDSGSQSLFSVVHHNSDSGIFEGGRFWLIVDAVDAPSTAVQAMVQTHLIPELARIVSELATMTESELTLLVMHLILSGSYLSNFDDHHLYYIPRRAVDFTELEWQRWMKAQCGSDAYIALTQMHRDLQLHDASDLVWEIGETDAGTDTFDRYFAPQNAAPPSIFIAYNKPSYLPAVTAVSTSCWHVFIRARSAGLATKYIMTHPHIFPTFTPAVIWKKMQVSSGAAPSGDQFLADVIDNGDFGPYDIKAWTGREEVYHVDLSDLSNANHDPESDEEA